MSERKVVLAMLASLSATLRTSWLRKTCVILGGTTLVAEGIYLILLVLTSPIRQNLNLIIFSAAWFLLGLLIAILGRLGGDALLAFPKQGINKNLGAEPAQGQGQLVL